MSMFRWFGAALLVPALLTIACSSTTRPAVQASAVPPVASAGSAQSVTMPVLVTLDGSASTASAGGTLSYAWTLTALPPGSAATLADAAGAAPTFTPDGYGFYTAQLIVSENGLASAPATVTITVSQYVSVLSNGSFEPDLAGWSTGLSAVSPTGTTGGWNSASPAPGTETLTSTAGFPATDGTATAIGSVTQTQSGEASSVLYQDVTFPAGASTARFSAAIGEKLLGGKSASQLAVFWGLYSTSAVPNYDSPTLVTLGTGYREPNASDTALVPISATGVNIASQAGNTVRLAFLIGTDSATGYGVAVVDNVVLDVLVTPTP